MENSKEEMEKLLQKMEKFEKDRTIYNWVSIILSILDVICGIVCIVYSSIVVASTVISLLTGIIIGGRTIQVIKAERLAKTLGIVLKQSWVRRVFMICFTFLSIRIKRSNKSMAKWIKANKWSIISAFVAAGVVASSVWFVIAAYWVTAPLWAEITITIASGLVSMIAAYFLGAEKVVQYSLRIASNKLPKDKVEQLTSKANEMMNEIAKAKEEEIAKEQAEAELAKAKSTIEAYEKAKQIVAEYERNNAETNA